jgi:hypothetical protein
MGRIETMNSKSFRAPKTHAKRPKAANLERVVARQVTSSAPVQLPYAPARLTREEADHFKALALQLGPEAFRNKILFQYLANAARLWVAKSALMDAIIDDRLYTSAGKGGLVVHPLINAHSRMDAAYDACLARAGLTHATKMTAGDLSAAKKAREMMISDTMTEHIIVSDVVEAKAENPMIAAMQHLLAGKS